MIDAAIRHILFPITESLAGRPSARHWRFLREHERMPIENIRAEQRRRLFNMIRFASETIPYYRDLFAGMGIEFAEETIVDDIKRIPLLTRSTLRRNYDALKNPHSEERFIENRTGGSTGEPVKLLRSWEMAAWGQASRWYFHEIAGHHLGERMLQLWGAERDMVAKKVSWKPRLLRHLMNISLIGCFRMDEEDMGRLVTRINREKPVVLHGYVECLTGLADYILCNKLQVEMPKLVITAASTLWPSMRKKIESAFGSPTFNFYGTRDAGTIAVECPAHQGLHTNPFTHYLEVIDSDGRECEPGETGQLVITLLMNRVMPLIRYPIGDLATLLDGTCPCGRTFPRLGSIEGRITETFVSGSGALVVPAFFIHLMGVVHGKGLIRRFQVIQETQNQIVVKIVPSRSKILEIESAAFETIREEIVHQMGAGTEVVFREVESIEPGPTGKYVYTISHVSGKEANHR